MYASTAARCGISLAAGEDRYYEVVEVPTGTLLLGADGVNLTSVLLSSPASPTHAIAPTALSDRFIRTARIGDNLTAVCYSEGSNSAPGNRVMLVTIDDLGQRVSEPVVVADGIDDVGGCDLAWSGTQLLVAWWDMQLDLPASTPRFSVVRARILSMP